MRLAADRLHRVGHFVLTAGGSDESVTIFAGRVDAPPADADGIAGYAGLASEHEDIRTRVLPASVAIENAVAGPLPQLHHRHGAALVRRPPGLAAHGVGGVSERLYLDDAYATPATAIVRAVLPGGVMLDRSPFYARSGGQPGDTGRLTWPGGETPVPRR